MLVHPPWRELAWRHRRAAHVVRFAFAAIRLAAEVDGPLLDALTKRADPAVELAADSLQRHVEAHAVVASGCRVYGVLRKHAPPTSSARLKCPPWSRTSTHRSMSSQNPSAWRASGGRAPWQGCCGHPPKRDCVLLSRAFERWTGPHGWRPVTTRARASLSGERRGSVTGAKATLQNRASSPDLWIASTRLRCEGKPLASQRRGVAGGAWCSRCHPGGLARARAGRDSPGGNPIVGLAHDFSRWCLCLCIATWQRELVSDTFFFCTRLEAFRCATGPGPVLPCCGHARRVWADGLAGPAPQPPSARPRGRG